MNGSHHLCKQCGGTPKLERNPGSSKKAATFYVQCRKCKQRTKDHATMEAAWQEWDAANAPAK
jgi:hypothetical protein